MADGDMESSLGGTFMIMDLRNCVPDVLIEKLISLNGRKGAENSHFQFLSEKLTQLLSSAPPPGPATYVMKCLDALARLNHQTDLIFVIFAAYSNLGPVNKGSVDIATAQQLAASLFISTIRGTMHIHPRVIVRMCKVFKVTLRDLERSWTEDCQGKLEGAIDEAASVDVSPPPLTSSSDTDQEHGLAAGDSKMVRDTLTAYVASLVRNQSYTPAVALMKHFDLSDSFSQQFLIRLMEDDRPDLASSWAGFLRLESFLVQHCMEQEQFKLAYRLTQQYNLEAEFPGAFISYRKSSLTKLVEKGIWDVAEAIVRDNEELQQFLVKITAAAGEMEQAQDLASLFGLQNFLAKSVESLGEGMLQKRYLLVEDFMPQASVIWVDSPEALENANAQLDKASRIGLDCEWRPHLEKGAPKSKVAILQLASEDHVFVIDVLHLASSHPTELNTFVASVFQAPHILKLGYGLSNDLSQLARSYPEVAAFQLCAPILDVQHLAGKDSGGGLSGLAKKCLGYPLNKLMRMSDWEERPLSLRQMNYAALDAITLLPIHTFLESQSASSRKQTSSFSFQLEVSNLENPLPSHNQEMENLPLHRHLLQILPPLDRSHVLMAMAAASVAAVEWSVTHSTARSPGGIKEDIGEDPQLASLIEEMTKDELSSREQANAPQFLSGWPWQLGQVMDEAEKGEFLKGKASVVGPHGILVSESAEGVPSGKLPMSALLMKGEEVARKTVQRVACVGVVVAPCPVMLNMKGRLQEFAQQLGRAIPEYTSQSWGPPHQQIFQSTVTICGVSYCGGLASKKREAETMAAATALREIAHGSECGFSKPSYLDRQIMPQSPSPSSGDETLTNGGMPAQQLGRACPRDGSAPAAGHASELPGGSEQWRVSGSEQGQDSLQGDPQGGFDGLERFSLGDLHAILASGSQGTLRAAMVKQGSVKPWAVQTQLLLAVIPEGTRLALPKIATCLECPQEALELCTELESILYLGFHKNCMPFTGHRSRPRVFIDQSLGASCRTIVCPAGAPDEFIAIDLTALVSLTGAQTADLTDPRAHIKDHGDGNSEEQSCPTQALDCRWSPETPRLYTSPPLASDTPIFPKASMPNYSASQQVFERPALTGSTSNCSIHSSAVPYCVPLPPQTPQGLYMFIPLQIPGQKSPPGVGSTWRDKLPSGKQWAGGREKRRAGPVKHLPLLHRNRKLGDWFLEVSLRKFEVPPLFGLVPQGQLAGSLQLNGLLKAGASSSLHCLHKRHCLFKHSTHSTLVSDIFCYPGGKGHLPLSRKQGPWCRWIARPQLLSPHWAAVSAKPIVGTGIRSSSCMFQNNWCIGGKLHGNCIGSRLFSRGGSILRSFSHMGAIL